MFDGSCGDSAALATEELAKGARDNAMKVSEGCGYMW
jgi:hypothetical protein